MRVKGEIKGGKEAAKLLDELPEKITNRVIQAAVMGAAREGAKGIRASAPTAKEPSDASKKYGPLRKNIRVSRLKPRGRNERGAKIHTGNAFWGFIYEIGSRFQPARPWFKPRFESDRQKILGRLVELIKSGFDREVKRK